MAQGPNKWRRTCLIDTSNTTQGVKSSLRSTPRASQLPSMLLQSRTVCGWARRPSFQTNVECLSLCRECTLGHWLEISYSLFMILCQFKLDRMCTDVRIVIRHRESSWSLSKAWLKKKNSSDETVILLFWLNYSFNCIGYENLKREYVTFYPLTMRISHFTKTKSTKTNP